MQLVFQPEVFPEDEADLRSEFEDLVEVKYTVNGPEFSKPPDTDFVFRGGIQLGRRLKRLYPKCTTWLYDNVYDCNAYLPSLGDSALNNPHVFCEAGTLSLLLATLDENNVFIKQNSGYKTFTGEIYSNVRDEVAKLFPHELLLLAPIRRIGPEWRFVISDMKVLTFSPYLDITGEPPISFVEETLQKMVEPAPMWTLDVCRLTSGEPKVVEINSLLTAGWYSSDRRLIIDELKKVLRT